MNIGEYSVRNKVVSWLLVVIMVGGGVLAFDKMGKLEDPPFTIKSAKILTPYPGATAREVQEELTYHLEDAIQRMPQLKRIRMSVSRPGLSDILIEFKDEYQADDLPNIFDELRRKIADVTPSLPPGASPPTDPSHAGSGSLRGPDRALRPSRCTHPRAGLRARPLPETRSSSWPDRPA